MMGQNEFLATNEFIDWLAGYACKPAEGWMDEICENILFLIAGFDEPKFNMVSNNWYFQHVSLSF